MKAYTVAEKICVHQGFDNKTVNNLLYGINSDVVVDMQCQN